MERWTERFKLVSTVLNYTSSECPIEYHGYKLVDIIEGRTKDEVLAKLKSMS